MSIRSKNKTRAKIAAQGKHSVTIQRTNKHFYAQVQSPEGIVLGGGSTMTPEIAKKMKKSSGGESNLHLRLFLWVVIFQNF